jgi:hypothetical protein
MPDTLESRTITMRIARAAREVYDFAAAPENFPRWASGLGRALKKVNGEWIADTPDGLVKVRFTERNDFGILDHHVTLRSGVEVYIPMRVIANATGSEVLFTLFRLPEMTDETFARDAQWVERDLRALKLLLEGQAREAQPPGVRDRRSARQRRQSARRRASSASRPRSVGR